MVRQCDLIVPLGGNCSVAMQLSWRNKRPFALGLDWTYMRDASPIDYLAHAFETNFADFAMKENLCDISTAYPKTYTSPAYKDSVSGLELPHQFRKYSTSDTWYEEDGAKLKRRIARMLSMVAECKSVLFILATAFEYEEDKALRLCRTIRKTFDGTTCSFRFMMFNAGRDDICDDGEGVVFQRIARPVHKYDFYATSAIWSFLDDIDVLKCRQEKMSSLDRLRYRLWKHLGKKLKRKGVKLNFVFK